MVLMQVVFILVAVITLVSALMVVTVNRIPHAAMWLVLVLVGVAVLFALLDAGFLVVVQIMVYVGAIAILIIFALMLTRKAMEDTGPQVGRTWWSLLASGGVFMVLVGALSPWEQMQSTPGALPVGGLDIAELGRLLVEPEGFVIPFEVASLLLLAAMIGAAYVALRKGGRE
jgi:NADH-quinone oxidoreductase subunit J